MSNQTLFIVVIIAGALIAGFFYYRNKALTAVKKVGNLSKSLEASERTVARLSEELSSRNYPLR